MAIAVLWQGQCHSTAIALWYYCGIIDPKGQCLYNSEWSGSGRNWTCQTELDDQVGQVINLFYQDFT